MRNKIHLSEVLSEFGTERVGVLGICGTGFRGFGNLCLVEFLVEGNVNACLSSWIAIAIIAIAREGREVAVSIA